MKKLFSIGALGFLTAGCSHIGNIDKSKLHGKTSYKLASGQEVILPLQYENWEWMMATYSVPVSQIKKNVAFKAEANTNFSTEGINILRSIGIPKCYWSSSL
jgi:hypothetical protein